MQTISGRVIATSGFCVLLPIALAGCAQVFGIDGWSEQSAGGAGGAQSSSTASSSSSSSAPGSGGMASASSGTGGQGGQGTTASSSVGPGGQGPASSSAASTGGQGGTGVASSSAGTGGQGGSGGTVNLDERCDNGLDDDLDNHIDCADTDCTAEGYKCAKGYPLPWKGPVVLYTGSPNNPLPPCGEGWANPSDFLAGTLIADPIQCGSCSCGAPTGGQCLLPSGVGVNIYGDTGCTNTPMAFTGISQPNVCTFVNNPTPLGSDYSVKLAGQAIVSGGSCAPMSGPPTIPTAYFSEYARICERATMAGGCLSGFACAAPPPAQFKSSVCIYQTLDDNSSPAVCPMPYGQQTMLYKGISDQRSCTACQCASASGTCATTLSLFFDQACGSLGFDLTPGQCGLLINDGAGLSATITVGPANMSGCAPIFPAPQGSVTGTGRTQVCCIP